MVVKPKNRQVNCLLMLGIVSLCHENDLEFSCKQVLGPGNGKHRYYAEFFQQGADKH